MTDRPHTGGDMTDGIGNTARAHLETADEIAATPTDITVDLPAGQPAEPEGGVTIGNRAQWPHAKVVLLMVSAGRDDADRSYEQFIADIERALVERGVAKAATVTGGYYIVNGKVCNPDDYDPATRDFKPGATPPQWAGGPAPARKSFDTPPDPEERAEMQRAHRAGKLPRRAIRVPTEVPEGASAEDAVRALAEGINREVAGE